MVPFKEQRDFEGGDGGRKCRFFPYYCQQWVEGRILVWGGQFVNFGIMRVCMRKISRLVGVVFGFCGDFLHGNFQRIIKFTRYYHS